MTLMKSLPLLWKLDEKDVLESPQKSVEQATSVLERLKQSVYDNESVDHDDDDDLNDKNKSSDDDEEDSVIQDKLRHFLDGMELPQSDDDDDSDDVSVSSAGTSDSDDDSGLFRY